MSARISSATGQGARPYQEDRFVVKTVNAQEDVVAGILLAVADGHGGDATSSYVQQQLSGDLFDRILAGTKNNPKEAISRTFQYLNDETYQLSEKSGLHCDSGTTLSIVFIPAFQVIGYIGIIGDSPVIVAFRDGTIQISPDHNARTNKKERKEALMRGGRYANGYIMHPSGSKGLQMTRDLGFHSMGNVLRRDPDIYDVTIRQGTVILLGSDGLLDPAHDGTVTEDEAKRLAKLVLDGAEAKDLISDALSRETGDNVTAIVWRC